MAVFRYEALNAQGKTVKGSMEADSPRAARNQMRMQGMTPIEVLEVGSAKMTGKKAGRFDRELSNREVVLLTRQLASLLQARLALAQALAALVEQAEKPLIRERINSIRSEVVSGLWPLVKTPVIWAAYCPNWPMRWKPAKPCSKR